MSTIKDILRNSAIGPFLVKLFYGLKHTLVSDRVHVQRKFKKSMGRPINLKDPKSLNEKINWLKLHDRTELHTQCADKYEVRKYISSTIGDQFLIPLYLETTDLMELNDESITFPCIIKTNHDSSGGIILRSKEDVESWQGIRNSLAKRMKRNYYKESREWQYKNIQPRIIVEKLLLDHDGRIPSDIKVHVIAGKVEMIQVDMNRGTNDHFRNWYDSEWNLLPMKWSALLANGKVTDPKDVKILRPTNLNEMLELSKTLARPFRYARIDWYDLEDRIYFGEITFHHDGGYRPILPLEWDISLGQKLKLNI